MDTKRIKKGIKSNYQTILPKSKQSQMPMFRPEHEEQYDRTHRTLNPQSIKMYNNPEYAK